MVSGKTIAAIFAVILLFGCAGTTETKETPTATAAPTSTPAVTATPAAQASPTPTPTPTTPAPAIRTIPAAVESNCLGFLVGGAGEALSAQKAGAGWLRPHPGPFSWGFIEKTKGQFDFSAADEFVSSAQEHNLTILGTVWPFADWDQTCASNCEVSRNDQFYPGHGQGIPAKRCKPCDANAYKKFLEKLVERYDGDGVDDMPGLLIPVKYWEVLNEPEMKEDFLTFFKGTAEDYVEVLKESSEAIRSACKDCKVVQGGSAGMEGGPTTSLDYWKKVYSLGAAQYVDVANIHCIGCSDGTLKVKDFEAMLSSEGVDKPVWVTEVEFRGTQDVKAPFLGALDAGASKVFFVSFRIGGHEPVPPGQFDPAYAELPALCK